MRDLRLRRRYAAGEDRSPRRRHRLHRIRADHFLLWRRGLRSQGHRGARRGWWRPQRDRCGQRLLPRPDRDGRLRDRTAAVAVAAVHAAIAVWRSGFSASLARCPAHGAPGRHAAPAFSRTHGGSIGAYGAYSSPSAPCACRGIPACFRGPLVASPTPGSLAGRAAARRRLRDHAGRVRASRGRSWRWAAIWLCAVGAQAVHVDRRRRTRHRLPRGRRSDGPGSRSTTALARLGPARHPPTHSSLSPPE